MLCVCNKKQTQAKQILTYFALDTHGVAENNTHFVICDSPFGMEDTYAHTLSLSYSQMVCTYMSDSRQTISIRFFSHYICVDENKNVIAGVFIL